MKWELIKVIEEQGYKLAGFSENQMGLINIAIESNSESENDSDIRLEEPKKTLTWAGNNFEVVKTEADNYVKVGDRFYIEKLTVKATGSFKKIELKNVPVIAVDVREDGVLFNFERILFSHCIDDNYTKGDDFEETELGDYLKNTFKNALEKAIGVDVKDCSLLTKENVFEKDSEEYMPFFDERKNRIKTLLDDSDTWFWWLKTLSSAYSASFCGVHDGGDGGSILASYCDGGVAPAFLITRC